MEKQEERQFEFAAIDPVIERLIERPTEKKQGGSDMVRWGDRNTYPQYIDGLANDTPTLRSVILGWIDYICGNKVEANIALSGLPAGFADRRGTSFEELFRKLASSVARHGGLAVKVTRNVALDAVAELESLPVKYIRTDEDNECFWYSEKWEKGASDKLQYPRFVPGARVAESVFFLKLWGEGAYPEPIYAASVKACECERSIDDYHLGNLSRGFMGSYLVNFNGGVIPTDQMKKETERAFCEKFAGHTNAGRVMFSWNRNKDAQTTFQKMEVSDYGEKYNTLAEHCRQQIFTAFRANPNLFGVPTAQGFNAEEYESSFKLFNRTLVQPVQRRIAAALEFITGTQGTITIEPFTMDGYEKKEVEQ